MVFTPATLTKPILFGSFTVTSQVFHLTAHSFALVNIKPLLPGHVLVSPIRRVSRIHELTPAEVNDLFLTVQRVGRMVERVFQATSLNIAIQDGSDAGQSVPHVHAHIIPRRPADFPETDDIYKEMEGPAGDVGRHQEEARKGKFPAVHGDDQRKARSTEEMNKEAEWLAQEMEREVEGES